MRMTLSRNEIPRQKPQMNVTSTLFYFIKSLLNGSSVLLYKRDQRAETQK